MALTYEGNLGIGITNPTEKLNVQGNSFFSGEATFGSNVVINGNLSATFLGSLLDSQSQIVVDVEERLLQGNVNTNSGISTFNRVSIASTLISDNIIVGTGVTTRADEDFVIMANSGDSGFFVTDLGGIGISTTVALSQNIGVNAIQKEAVFAGVGIGTLAPTCVADFAHAGTLGITTTHRYFLPPKVGTTDRNGIGITETGATIYNTDLNKLQVYTGSAWETITSA